MLTALVIGSANTLSDDVAGALALFEPDVVIGCNHAARDWPSRLDAFVTMHPDLLPMWIKEREAKGFPPAGRYWHARHRIVPFAIASTPVESWGGSSGLLCVAVAFELGCDRTVLAGVPMLKNARHYDSSRPWDEARAYHAAWEKHFPAMRGRVKSMSGWTRDLLGGPEEGNWLADVNRPTDGAAR